jgi:hypothetical protein
MLSNRALSWADLQISYFFNGTLILGMKIMIVPIRRFPTKKRLTLMMLSRSTVHRWHVSLMLMPFNIFDEIV